MDEAEFDEFYASSLRRLTGQLYAMIGNVSLKFSDSFTLSGIALGTIVAVGLYHLARWLAPKELRDASDGAALVFDPPGAYADEDAPVTTDKV